MKRSQELAKAGKINKEANIKDQHSIIINVPIEAVWDALVSIKNWSNWNPQISSVDGPEKISEGTIFSWTNKKVKTKAEVQLFKPMSVLSWYCKSYWVNEIYVWSLESDENQTIITLEASMQGVFIFFVNSHPKVYIELLNWVENLKKMLEKG